MPIERKLAAIMFVDVVGYSRMMASNEERTLELLKDFENICSPIISMNSGEIIKKVGDELFCEFSSAKQAVDCAVSIQEAIQPYNDSRPKDFKLQVRIGIHIGDVVKREDGDIHGDGVNVASRIQPFASPGGICVSNSVRDALSSHPNYEIQSEGKQELKNIIEKHTLYSIKTGFEDKRTNRTFKKSNKTIPILIGILVLSIVGMIYFGDNRYWQTTNNMTDDNSQNVHLIYIGSLEENRNIAEWRAENFLSENEGTKVSLIDESELKNIRLDIEAELYSEFYNQKLIIQMLKNDEEIGFVNNSIKEYREIETLAGSIYNFFDSPKHIIFIRVYAIKSLKGEILQYAYDVYGALGDGWKYIMRDGGTIETIQDLNSSILEMLVWQIEEVKHNFSRWNAGEVIKSEGNYVYINPLGLKMKKNMNLIGYRKWNLYDNDGDGFTDKDSSYYAFLNDVKEGLDYIKNTEKYNEEKIYLEKQYNWLTTDSLSWFPKGKVSKSHRYSLKVVSVKIPLTIC